jgi:preprotein translocase subunit SecB
MQFSPKSHAKLRFHGVDIIDLKFSASQPHDNESTIDVDITPSVFYPEGEPMQFKLLMEVDLKSDGFFTLTLRAIGYFNFSEELAADERKNMVNRNASAIMFPYVRAAISTLSATFGNTLGTLHIPTQFFSDDIAEIKTDKNDIQPSLPSAEEIE